jgi:uncharacterized protein YcfL
MNIFNKIEEIREKPEHIRLRWAWGLTAVGTVCIVIIWMISFASQMENSAEDTQVLNTNQVVTGLSAQKKSIEDSAGQIKSVLGNQSQGNAE